MPQPSQNQHNIEISNNLTHWQKKKLLQIIYHQFYTQIAHYIRKDLSGYIVELGSGIGNLKSVIPSCICTDIFPNPWLDQVENAYKLSFEDQSVSNLVLFDVFHHLQYPGTALKEFHRVLKREGRVILFEPGVSVLGRLVYGWFHHEPLGLKDEITWEAEKSFCPDDAPYYAAQGNASRIFFENRYRSLLSDWNLLEKKKMSSISYVASGGYSQSQFYPVGLLPFMQWIDGLCDWVPRLFTTRLLIVLEKNSYVGEMRTSS